MRSIVACACLLLTPVSGCLWLTEPPPERPATGDSAPSSTGDSAEAPDDCADEICDHADNDCDGAVDEGLERAVWYLDGDGDGYGREAVEDCWAFAGYAERGGDCDDTDASVSPGAAEICDDGVDNDCDGRDDPCARRTPGDAAVRLYGEVEGGGLGGYVWAAGDLTGDGAPDVLVRGWSGELDRLYLLPGPLGGPDGAIEQASGRLRLDGEASGDLAGTAVAALGDADGDGFDDVLIGARGEDARSGEAGLAYLLRGPVSADLGLGAAHAALLGVEAGDNTGVGVGAPGDVDGDGLADLLVGASSFGWGHGAAYLWLGAPSGTVSLDDAHARLEGEGGDDHVGRALGGTDLNSDGLGDLVIAAYGAGGDGGRIYIWYGPGPLGSVVDISLGDAALSGDDDERLGYALAAGDDLDGDGAPDLVIGAPYNQDAATEGGAVYAVVVAPEGEVAIRDVAAGRALGSGYHGELGSSVASVPDADGDGRAEVAAGCAECGGVWLWYGPVQGALLDAQAGWILQEDAEGTGLGRALAGVADLTGDGWGDLLVGAPDDATSAEGGGAALLFTATIPTP